MANSRNLAPHVQAAIAAAAQPKLQISIPKSIRLEASVGVSKKRPMTVLPHFGAVKASQNAGSIKDTRAIPQGAVQAMLKKYEGSTGKALRMLGEVSATGTLKTEDGTITATAKNGGYCWLPNWLHTYRKLHDEEVRKAQEKGKKVPFPGNDAEVHVLSSLSSDILERRLRTGGGELSLKANGTDICKYCRKLIRIWCKHYGVTWVDDPQFN